MIRINILDFKEVCKDYIRNKAITSIYMIDEKIIEEVWHEVVYFFIKNMRQLDVKQRILTRKLNYYFENQVLIEDFDELKIEFIDFLEERGWDYLKYYTCLVDDNLYLYLKEK